MGGMMNGLQDLRMNRAREKRQVINVEFHSPD